MRIAIITPFFPGRTTGGKKHFLDIIKGLSGNNEVFLISRIEPDEVEGVKEMESYCRILYLYEFKTPEKRNILNLIRIIASYYLFARKARNILKGLDVDVIQVSYTDLGLFLHKRKSIKKPMVLDTHDVNTVVAKRNLKAAGGLLGKIKASVGLSAVKIAERYTVRQFDMVTARSSADARFFRGIGLNTPVVRQPAEVPKERLPREEREAGSLLFVGAMQRELNVRYVKYFYEDILPKIRERVGRVTFYVAGNRPPEILLEMARKDSFFKVTGFVEDMSQLYGRSMVFVSPVLVGGGVIVKNLEAMAHGLPVVTTTLGNEGIEAVHERDLLIADTAEEFADCVVRLLKNEELREKVSANAVRFIKENFNSEGVIKTIEDAYKGLVSGNG